MTKAFTCGDVGSLVWDEVCTDHATHAEFRKQMKEVS
jgi:hypothetical protein